MTAYITINDDVDSWGDCVDFDTVAEGNRIAEAAEAAGITVIRNVSHGVSAMVDDDDAELDWWGVWCTSGYEWTDEQWIDWMQSQV